MGPAKDKSHFPSAPLHLKLGDDLLLGHIDDGHVLHGEGGIRDDGQQPGVHLLGHGGSGQHGGQDGLRGRRQR